MSFPNLLLENLKKDVEKAEYYQNIMNNGIDNFKNKSVKETNYNEIQIFLNELNGHTELLERALAKSQELMQVATKIHESWLEAYKKLDNLKMIANNKQLEMGLQGLLKSHIKKTNPEILKENEIIKSIVNEKNSSTPMPIQTNIGGNTRKRRNKKYKNHK